VPRRTFPSGAPGATRRCGAGGSSCRGVPSLCGWMDESVFPLDDARVRAHASSVLAQAVVPSGGSWVCVSRDVGAVLGSHACSPFAAFRFLLFNRAPCSARVRGGTGAGMDSGARGRAPYLCRAPRTSCADGVGCYARFGLDGGGVWWRGRRERAVPSWWGATRGWEVPARPFAPGGVDSGRPWLKHSQWPSRKRTPDRSAARNRK